ncbi:hypothetical protein BN2364_1759 [Alloalcanivorax xenomutans]|uniref:hypothetical protein n=1 Tax=Alloalcanivorax xenomutans TaxID=1094342 RepID=UPI0006D5CC43|nr:hypothetical protein [Alloalcanivorax xenomutans]CUR46200.1 hypothetical protein BN2364_1759 [Alloalcanivorax xenomutans]
MTQLAPDTQEMLDSLRTAVAETLERKRRLGQYAVIWQDGKPVLVGEDAPPQQADEQYGQDQESHW